MNSSQRFAEAIDRFDEANSHDPRIDTIDGRSVPREQAFAQRVYAWIEQMAADPSAALLLAARSHTLRRWEFPRDQYPTTTAGYHTWRKEIARFHADKADAILVDVGYDAETCDRVKALITRANFPADAEAQTLEDADCLAFLELKLARCVGTWGEDRTVHILRKTLKKMTERGRELAGGLSLPEAAAGVVARASA